MESRSAPAAGEPSAPPRQRWRLILARSADAARIGGRELADAWEESVAATGLPLHLPSGRARARVAFGAPLPLGIAAEREPAEVFLTERIPVWRIRDALSVGLPDGWRLLEVFDVWVGGPPLAGRVVAADYRIEIDDGGDPGAVEAAAHEMLEANHLPRLRQKGDTTVPYDLRQLLADIVVDRAAPRPCIRVRTRIHPELGTGRPEEVVAALGEMLGHPLEVAAVVRERLILADDIG